MDVLLGIILSVLTSMGLSADMPDSCVSFSDNSSSATQVPCPPPAPTDTTDDEGGSGLIKVGGSGLIKVGGSG
ncbi:MAG: hypothetical protein ACI8RZ_005309 [Myxococcota bacterium]|jgi:hypothetical protein